RGDGAPLPPFTQHVTDDLDLLFVIDNSASTSDKQTLFVQNFPSFVAALDGFPGGRPNLHLGVVTTTVDIGASNFGPGCPSPDPNDNGLLVNTPRVATGCSGPSGRFISDIASSTGGRTTNYTGTLSDAFSCIAQVGATGCGFEAQLEGMKRALDSSRPENAGFRRTSANLAIVILTDEDDCSAADPALFGLGSDSGPGDFRCQPLYAYSCDQPISAAGSGSYTNCTVRTGSYLRDPAYYYQFLTTLADPANLYVAVIGGDPKSSIQTGMITTPFSQSLALEPSCTATINGNPAIGRPGIRLADFVQQLGRHGLYESVCQSDYSAALSQIGQLLQDITSTCVAGSIDTTDTDASNPGVQPPCAVTQNGTTIPMCHMLDATTPASANTTPCAWFAVDAACAATPSQLELHLLGGTTPVDLSCAPK
ncbi:MAG: hypothetical protein ACM31C_12615, partial [Acidobacteriota bacterium]